MRESCPLCNLQRRARRSLEIKLHRQEMTHSYLETRSGWSSGTVAEHMESHLDYTPEEEAAVEELRLESIDTLNTADSVLQRMVGWLDEWEELKDEQGMDPEWVSMATRLVGEVNRSLKLIGQLKKEIGTDSQLFLADQRMGALSRILVEVLRTEPHLLDQIELRMGALRPPRVQDVEYEVVE